MKVWVVYIEYECNVAVFSTQEKAKNYIRSMDCPRDFDLEVFQIDELELTKHLSGNEGDKDPKDP